ncbi:hypothetical protein EPUL_004982 [Erysiphe pulchra]|uniref:CCHC-type domain-containing protein n=1 Tax=Erysiphe pulchra TaxID=225359 RepID=A0A2S4PN72_9PEZI|nr:hypothetical protein EPUL_004982 [Erysiphe pulchra]
MTLNKRREYVVQNAITAEAEVEETPEVFFESIDLNFSGEAADWVDSTPQYQIFTEQLKKPTIDEMKDFKTALVARFPAKFSVDRSEDTIQEDTGNLTQGSNETLEEYYGRAQHLLRHSHTRDTPVEGASSLSPSERILLRGMIKAFIRDLHDNSLKRTIVTRPTPCSLRSAFDQDQQALTGIKQMEQVERAEYEKMEIELLRRQYFERNGRPLRSILAEIDQRNITHQIDEQLKRMVLFNMEPQQVHRLSNQQTGRPIRQNSGYLIDEEQKSLIVTNSSDKTANNHQPYVKFDKGEMAGPSAPKMPPKSLSRHPVVYGTKSYDKIMGALCFQCGEIGHRKPECKSRALEYWEQKYLKEIIFNKVNSNFTGFENTMGLRFRDIGNSNWRNHGHRENVNLGNTSFRHPQQNKNENPSYQGDKRGVTSEQFSSESFRNQTANHNTQKKEVFDKGKKKVKFNKPIDDELATLDAFLNLGNTRKKARPMDIEDLLNGEEQGAKTRKKELKRGRRATRQLR